MIKVTPQMASRWVKGAFLALLGIIILIYADGFVDELRINVESSMEVTFDVIWDLLIILLWILVAWLFVDAVLTIALSFSVQRYSLDDVMKRLLRIERKLGIVEPRPAPKVEEEEIEEEKAVVTEEEPPPPPPPARD